MSPAEPQPGQDRQSLLHWRTVDIVVAAVIGVAVGIVFWVWSVLWNATTGLFAFFPPAQAILYGMWMVPGVLGGLIIRKPGAAVLTSIAPPPWRCRWAPGGASGPHLRRPARTAQ